MDRLIGLMRRVCCGLFIAFGALMVSRFVDKAPYVGSPQIDYGNLNPDWPFWPQFALVALYLVVGGALLAALALHAWNDAPERRPLARRTLAVGLGSALVIAALSFALFVTLGTMGPLGVAQPILRFALTNGAISGLIIALAYGFVGKTPRGSRRIVAFAAWGLGSAACLITSNLAIALAGGLPVAQAQAFGALTTAFIAVLVGLSAALRKPAATA